MFCLHYQLPACLLTPNCCRGSSFPWLLCWILVGLEEHRPGIITWMFQPSSLLFQIAPELNNLLMPRAYPFSGWKRTLAGPLCMPIWLVCLKNPGAFVFLTCTCLYNTVSFCKPLPERSQKRRVIPSAPMERSLGNHQGRFPDRSLLCYTASYCCFVIMCH
jgi:hypothetical protein